MPQLISLKFAQELMPRVYDPNGVGELQVQDFVVAEREGEEDVGFVAGIEWVSSEQLKRRTERYKRILRRANETEKNGFFERRALERKALALCKEKAREFKLAMKISSARVAPRDNRIVFHFTSEQRVDFRQLVRELSLILKTRIELWQIGVRDEAKEIDGFGLCGLRTCCSQWLPEFRPINIRMAKDQDIHLPPVKLSGLCGRLLCCLSYEVDQYRAMNKALLPKGATIRVGEREGVIMDRNVIMQSYSVQFEEGSLTVVKAEEVQDLRVPDQMKRMAEKMSVRFEKPADQEGAPAEERESTGEERAKKRRRRRGKRGGAGATSSDQVPRRERPQGEARPERSQPEGGESGAAEGDKKSGRRRRRRRGRRGGGSGGESGASGQD